MKSSITGLITKFANTSENAVVTAKEDTEPLVLQITGGTGIINDKYYKDGNLFTGLKDDHYYRDGVLGTGDTMDYIM